MAALKFRVTLLLAGLLLASCGNTLAQRQAALAPLVGRSEADLVRALGVPTRTFETEGRRFLAYTDSRSAVIPGSYGPQPWGPWGPGGFYGPWGWGGVPPQVVVSVCETVFEVSADRVVSFSLHGSGCG